MRKRTETGKQKSPPKGCNICGGWLDEKGFCATGGGYPVTMLCPFVCPFCRKLLKWDGACMFCFGSHTPEDRATWTFPGDEYQVEGGHWINQGSANEVCTPQQNIACMEVVRLVLDGKLAQVEAQERIQGILHPEVPF